MLRTSLTRTEWTVTVDANNDGLVTINAVNEVDNGSAKIVKTSEDGIVEGVTFRLKGNGVDKTVTTDANGEVQIDDLKPGTYTVTETVFDKYEPQETRNVIVVSNQVATVTFNNVLKRGDLEVIKTSEDNLVEGVQFHLYGTSLSGLAVDEYAVTDKNGVATFKDVLISGHESYTLEEVDTAERYIVPDSQRTAIEWNIVTEKSFYNELKRVFKGEVLLDTYTTDENGYFLTKYYPCGDDYTIREITPSEGYLLDPTVYYMEASAEFYSIELNTIYPDVYEEIIMGDIAIIKHTDDGSTKIETPEVGAKFEIFLKAAGSYKNAAETERDIIVCDEHGFGQTKMLPYGVYTVHQVSGWEGRELMPDFEVYIAQDETTFPVFLITKHIWGLWHTASRIAITTWSKRESIITMLLLICVLKQILNRLYQRKNGISVKRLKLAE